MKVSFPLGQEFELVLAKARDLHGSVHYGGSRSLYDVIRESAEILYNSGVHDRTQLVKACLMQRAWDVDATDVQPLQFEEIQRLIGVEATALVRELSGIPGPIARSERTVEDVRNKRNWAQKLSPEAKEILLATEFVGLEIECKTPNTGLVNGRRAAYFNSVSGLIITLNEANPEIGNRARHSVEEAAITVPNYGYN